MALQSMTGHHQCMPHGIKPLVSGSGERTGGLRSVDAGVLITFPISHFCEKARWALDHAGLDYRENGYAPAVHKLAVGRHKADSVPVLVGEQTLRHSTEILRFADRACPAGRELYPAAPDERREMDELVEHLDLSLGPQVRRWFYAWALPDPRRLDAWASRGLAPRQRLILRVLAPKIAGLIAHRVDITEDAVAKAREGIDEEFRTIAAKLADGRPYISGEYFSATDLTFAALAGPALCPPGYGGSRLTLPSMPDDLASQILAWRATPAGQHGLRIYREHRALPLQHAAPRASSQLDDPHQPRVSPQSQNVLPPASSTITDCFAGLRSVDRARPRSPGFRSESWLGDASVG